MGNHIYPMENDMRIQGLDKPSYKGLDKDGLSIVILDGLESRRQIVKAICRQIDKPYIPIFPISPYHGLDGLSRPYQTTVYRRHTNIPIDIQTISSGYKGLVNMLDKRFEGLDGLIKM